ncbi:MAG: hydroxyacid dehydrogenase [Anaerolineae bacterium]|nr:hydroxyacid dehydrogenase [Anaerolineae bacterium]
MPRPIVAIAIGKKHYQKIMSRAAWEALTAFADVVEHPGQEPAAKPDLLSLLPTADACISSWGVAPFDADVLAAAPRLRAVAYAAGSVKPIVSDALWARHIHVTSAAPALGLSVAYTTLSLMIVGIKRILPLSRHVRAGGWQDGPYWPSRELIHKTVGIIGASHVGRHVIRLLQPFDAQVWLYDPYVSAEEARRIGATKVELDELLRRADVVSIHAPSLPETRHILNARTLALMKDDAILINTARGSLVDEAALVAELSKGRFFAFIDVTDPEPPAADHPFRRLENVVLTPHLAGIVEDATWLGEMEVEELRRFFAGEPPLNRVTREMLARIA